jgi:autotransporter-like protein/autochaperone domain-containing protein
MSSIPTPRQRAALKTFRATLFASAAVTALFLTCAAPVRADCTGTTEVVCTGDLHDGVHYSGPEKLTVRDLSTNIAPPIGQAGISLLNGGARHQTAAIEANVVPYRITTQGQLAPGIAARASGEVTIHSIGTIVTLGPRSEGVTAVSDTGTATVSNEADVFIYGSNANGILARGPAGASVTNSGDVAVHGPNSDALYARTFIRNGSIWGKASVFNDGHLSTFGVDSRGIFVHSAGDAEVTNSGGIAIGGGQSEGIFVSAYGHAVVHNSGDIAVTGQSSLGIHVFTQGFLTDESVELHNSGAITSDGDDSPGILAYAFRSELLLDNSGDIATSGNSSTAIEAASNPSASVSAETVFSVVNGGYLTTEGTESLGIDIQSNASQTKLVNRGRIETIGDWSPGIHVISRGDADITNAGGISTFGAFSYGILVTPGASAVIHNSGDVATSGRYSTGIKVYGPGAIALYDSGKVTTEGDSSHGLSALSDYAGVLISSTADIATSGVGSDGVRAQGTTRAEVHAAGTISTKGAGSAGIYAQSDGDVVVVSATDITTHGDYANAILVHNGLRPTKGEVLVTSRGNLRTEGGGSIGIDVLGTGSLLDLTAKGRVDTLGKYATGIQLWANYGDARLRNEAAVTTAGSGAAGIYARVDAGSLDFTNLANITTSGDNAPGIALNVTGPLTLYSSADIETEGSGSSGIAVLVISPADPEITIGGKITTHGSGAHGMLITAVNGHTTLNSSADITNLGDNSAGLRLIGRGAGQAQINSEGRLTSRGLNNRGIDARAYDSFMLGVRNDGDLDIAGDNAAGVSLYSFGTGNVSVTNSGRVAVTGGAPTGLTASSLSGDAAVENAGPVSIVGDYGKGIAATGVNARITNGGAIQLAGDFSTGMLAMASMRGAAPGTALIDNAGDVTITGTNSAGLYASSSFGPARVIVGSGTTVTGGSGTGFGVGLNSASEAILVNRGTIQSINDEAIFNGAGSGPLSIVNLGTVNGFVLLNDGEDDLDNQGRFTARGDSDFGAGVDSFLNNGTLRVADSGGADHVTFLGLETFANGPNGLITMMDGRAGDRLSFPSLTAFHGGGVLALDAELAGSGSPADLLTLSGVVSGRTLVRVNNTSKLPGVRGADDIFVIDQGSVPTGSEFALENGPIPVGFLDYDLRPDDDGSTFWELYQSGPNQKKIDELPVLMTGLQNLWHAGVSAWHQRMGDLVTLAAMPELQPAADVPGAPALPRMQGGLWLRGYGEQARYDTTVSVDFRQDIEGFQGGVDAVLPGPLGGDSVIAGLLGGFVRSDLDFKGSPDTASYEGDTVGAYLTYLDGGFHADLLFKTDLVTVTFDQAGPPSDFDATAIGGSFELGYKFDLGSGLFANPLGQLAYVSSRIDDGSIGSAPVAFDDGDSLRGRAGLRMGVLGTIGSLAVEPYVEAYLMHEFTGDDRAWVYDYPSAPSSLGSWGMAGAGVQVMAANLSATLLFPIIHGRSLAFEISPCIAELSFHRGA